MHSQEINSTHETNQSLYDVNLSNILIKVYTTLTAISILGEVYTVS